MSRPGSCQKRLDQLIREVPPTWDSGVPRFCFPVLEKQEEILGLGAPARRGPRISSTKPEEEKPTWLFGEGCVQAYTGQSGAWCRSTQASCQESKKTERRKLVVLDLGHSPAAELCRSPAQVPIPSTGEHWSHGRDLADELIDEDVLLLLASPRLISHGGSVTAPA